MRVIVNPKYAHLQKEIEEIPSHQQDPYIRSLLFEELILSF